MFLSRNIEGFQSVSVNNDPNPHYFVFIPRELLLRVFHLFLAILDKGVAHGDIGIDGSVLEGLILSDMK